MTRPGLLSRLRHGARLIVRKLAERALARAYDGADPPPRLVDEVRAFRVLRPDATRAEWEDFALGLAAGAWRDGFAFGVDWRERWGPVAFDEALLPPAEVRARNWTQPIDEDPGDPLAGVPEERRADVLREIEFASGYGGFRWVDEDARPIFPPAALPAAEEDGGDEHGDGGGPGSEEGGG